MKKSTPSFFEENKKATRRLKEEGKEKKGAEGDRTQKQPSKKKDRRLD